MRHLVRFGIVAIVCGVACLADAPAAKAADIDGVWITDKDSCDKAFVASPSGVAFSGKADMYGSGFIIAGKTIRGRAATCTIVSTARTGSTVKIVANCATDVMVSRSEFTLTLREDGKLTRSFPGIPDLTLDFYRCEFGR